MLKIEDYLLKHLSGLLFCQIFFFFFFRMLEGTFVLIKPHSVLCIIGSETLV